MQLDPQSRAVVDALNATGILPFHRFTPAESRARLAAIRPARPDVPADAMDRVTEESIVTGDGSFAVRILHPRPLAPGERMAAVIYFHGGGFFAGGLEETDMIVRRIAKRSDVVVINVDYHLSPESKFPVAVNDAYATLCWAVDQAARLGIDPDRIMIAGDSAGGNLTIVTCLMAREKNGPSIKFQIPIYPSLDLRARPQIPSRLKWGTGEYFLINDDIEWMLEHYLNDREEGNDWRVSPALAETYRGLPPALVVTASHDPLVDEGRAYADRLKADGVAVEYAQFEGTMHGFVSFAPVIDTAAQALSLICDRIAEAAAK